MDVVLESERDRRALGWLIDQVGSSAVEHACTQLAGDRKAYVSNIAKTLGLTLPDNISATPKDEALVHLTSIKNILKSRRGRG